MTVDVCTCSVPDRLPLLAEAIASVNSQVLLPQKHIITVDHARIQPGFARNAAAAGADAKYITFLDDDDLMLPHHLETLVTLAERESADIAYSEPIWHSRFGGKAPPNRPELPLGPFDRDKLFRYNYILSPMWVMRLEFFRAIGGFKITYPCEDWFILLEAANANARWSYTPDPTWIYRQGAFGT